MSIINTDIYNIVETINELKKSYIPDETEDTLALGIYGYIGDLEAKKIQIGTILTNELSNEVFPNRALLDKNIVTHAIMNGITDINATPAFMTVIIGILEDDLDKNMVNNQFILDKFCPIKIEDEYEFHLDYDIILTRSTSASKNTVYSAYYDMDIPNRISTIDNPYLKQPYTARVGNEKFVFLQCIIRQVSVENKYTQMITSSIIDNRTFTFNFQDQLADFEVTVTEGGKTTYITPIFEGSAINPEEEYYCYYTYVNDDTIRIKFERSSYMPGLNAEVTVIVKTTLGSEGVFTYDENMFFSYKSSIYGYENINLMLRPSTNSTGGVNRKSTAELHEILPKEILAKGSITTETDLTNYFNLMNTETNKLLLQKKVDNQIDRIYYAYLVMRNNDGDIIPTNTISLDIKDSDFYIHGENGSYILPAGTHIEYDPVTFVGKIIKYPSLSTSEYIYTTLYSIAINKDPIYSAFYMTIVSEDPYLSFEWINQDAEIQFISENIHFERRLIVNRNTYSLTLESTQNINNDMGMYVVEKNEQGEWVCVENNMKCFIVFYKDGKPYRYEEGFIYDYDLDYYKFNWEFKFNTNNSFDNYNNLLIENLGISGTLDRNYGYMAPNTEAYIYMLAKFDSEEGRSDLDDIIPGLDGYTVTNKYEVSYGINFFVNYSGILNSRVTVGTYLDTNNDLKNVYNLSGVPVLAYKYISNEDNVIDFIEQMNYKKMYIDNALVLLENGFEIDFKFFNTYGPARTYTVDDNEGTTSIGRVDIYLKFLLSLKSSSDVYTKNNIIQYIKDYIEDLESFDDLDFSNMLADIRENFKNVINYIDYNGFNTYDANYKHLYKQEVDDQKIPPEFINVRNRVNELGDLEPDIDIEVLV